MSDDLSREASADAATEDALVVFTPSGRRGRFALGTPVLDAARALGVDIDSVCGGRAICGRCRVTPAEGKFAKHGIESRLEHLSPAGEAEQRFAKRKSLSAGDRLSCQARIAGDLVVDIPAGSQVHRQVVRKRAELRDIRIDPVVRLHYVEVTEPDMHDPSSDLRRLVDALSREWGLGELTCDPHLFGVLQKTLRAGQWKVTAAVRNNATIIALWPGFRDRALGMAVDLGSTTIAAHLCDLSTGEVVAAGGRMNPQIRFGEDLMSRVSYVMMNPGGEQQLTDTVREALGGIATDVAAEAGVSTDEILEITLVGNPVMHHLVLGIDPTELGGAPFALAIDGAVTVRANELGFGVNPGARTYVLPCIAGHVGADAAAVVLSEEPHVSDEIRLVVDVGTNAEIVLGNRERLLACSSPTGPAFEGAQISAGQRAAPGAIERVRIDRATLEPRFKVIGADMWSDEPGFAAATAKTGITGICGSGIIEVLAEMFLAGILTTDGRIDGQMASRSPRIVADGRTFSYQLHDHGDDRPPIRIVQNDVRAIQLGKAALYAGVKLLMDRYGVSTVDRVTLAGAFGSHIDTTYAMVLGMIPDCRLDHVGSAGNAAGTGARIALLNRAAREEIEALVRRIEKVETAVEAKFQEHFVGAMGLPHATDPFEHLAGAVDLPAPSETANPQPEAGRGRWRRRGG